MTEYPGDYINDPESLRRIRPVEDVLLPARPLTASRLNIDETVMIVEALGKTNPKQVDRVLTAVEKLIRDREHEAEVDPYVHGADDEGDRWCGARGGLKTVFAFHVITCPECRRILQERESQEEEG